MLNSAVVRDHMTPLPNAVQCRATLSAAARCFEAWKVDCVPVFDGDAFCGVLHERDVNVARELGISLDDVLVAQVPLHDAHVASADAPLSRAAKAMVLQQVDTAVVQEGERCVGLLFLEGVVSVLAEGSTPALTRESDVDPSRVRSIILAEHGNIRRLLHRVEQAAQRVLSAPVPHLNDLRDVDLSTRRLCAVMEAHVELEDRLLAPTLEALDAWGKVRADRLRAEHAAQTLMLHDYVSALKASSSFDRTGAALAAKAQQLVDELRKDMQTEEESLLRPDLLCDDPTAIVVEAG